MAWVFQLNYPRPLPGLSQNDRAHYMTKGRNTAIIRAQVATLCRVAKVPKLERCRVEVVWVVNTHARRDVDTLAPLLKAIYDGVGADKGVSAHIVPDDAPEFMEKPSATIEYRKGSKAHFEVSIIDLTTPPDTGI